MNQASEVKEKLSALYLEKMKKIWNSHLNAINKCKATNILAIPIISHTFGSIRWTVNEILALDRKTRKTISKARSLHPNASIERLYLPRHQGGRGLTRIEDLYGRIALSTARKVYTSNDPLLNFTRDHELGDRAAFLFKAAKRAATSFGLKIVFDGDERGSTENCLNLTAAELKKVIKTSVTSNLLQKHTEKPMHGQYFKNVETLGLSAKLTFAFLNSPGLYSETEGFITSCQDGVFPSLVYQREIMGIKLKNTFCRACKINPETTMHLLAACPKYAPNLYIARRDSTLEVLYYHLRHKYNIDPAPIPPYRNDEIPSVVENEQIKIL